MKYLITFNSRFQSFSRDPLKLDHVIKTWGRGKHPPVLVRELSFRSKVTQSTKKGERVSTRPTGEPGSGTIRTLKGPGCSPGGPSGLTSLQL